MYVYQRHYKVTTVDVNVERPVGMEDVWVTVQHLKLPALIIGCLYRHPKGLAHTYDYIHNALCNISLRNKPYYLLGDFNENQLVGNKLLQN